MDSAQRIREARLAAGLTQVQLSRLIKAGQSNVCRWERGETSPSFRLLPALAKATGKDIAFFFPSDKDEDAA